MNQHPLFCLGGRDLEMETVRALVMETLGAGALADRGVGWGGARASAYLPEIRAALAAGRRPVLLELADDLPDDVPRDAVTFVDHHGANAGHTAPTTLEQVFALLGLPAERWTRRLALVAANDRGHIRGLRAMGADDAEIAAIRAADRRAQGITEAEEATGRTALAAAATALDGRLTVARLPHGRTATVADPFAITDPDRPLLVLSPGEVNVFAPGSAIAALAAAFPDGWSGGDLPHFGFWGHGEPMPALAMLLDTLSASLNPLSPPPGP